MLLLTGILIAISIVRISAYLWHVRQSYDFFKRLDIPGPSATLVFGSFLEIIKLKRISLVIRQWTEQYGRVYGYFEGHTPAWSGYLAGCLHQIVLEFSLATSFPARGTRYSASERLQCPRVFAESDNGSWSIRRFPRLNSNRWLHWSIGLSVDWCIKWTKQRATTNPLMSTRTWNASRWIRSGGEGSVSTLTCKTTSLIHI